MLSEEELLSEIKKFVKVSWEYSKEDRKRLNEFIAGMSFTITYGKHIEICPYCGELMHCDLVDIGVGEIQCAPYYCGACGASEIHISDDKSNLDEDEDETGFYKNKISPLANTVNGILVSHTEALELYPLGLLDNCKPKNCIS